MMTETDDTTPDLDRRLRRWRLILGGDAADGTGYPLAGSDLAMDSALSALYDAERKAGLGASSPHIARWLGDIRTYFPASVVRVMQQDAEDIAAERVEQFDGETPVHENERHPRRLS